MSKIEQFLNDELVILNFYFSLDTEDELRSKLYGLFPRIGKMKLPKLHLNKFTSDPMSRLSFDVTMISWHKLVDY